ncbi:MAG: alpha/beta hydrolase [Alphaproteobacteria bacterium]
MKIVLAALIAALFATSAQAQTAAKDPYPEARAQFADGVVGLPNVTYATYGGFRPLTLDLYLPAPSAEKHPIIVYVHGGGWTGGSPRAAGTFEDWPATLAGIAARGYVVAAINYRLGGEAKFPLPEQDVKAAIRWMRVNADKHGGDPARIVVWGGSTGGELAGLAATSCGVAALSPPAQGDAVSDCVQGAILWFPVTDIEALIAERPASDATVANLLGCKLADCAPGLARQASPVTHIDANDPPMLIVHGEADKTIPVSQSRVLYAALKAKGVDADLLILPGLDHGFVGASPEANIATNKMVIARVNAFLDRIVGPASRKKK